MEKAGAGMNAAWGRGGAGPAGSSPFAVETSSRSTMQVSEPDPRASRNRHAASRRKGKKKRDRTIFPQVLRTLLAFDGETVRPVGTVRPILVALPTFGQWVRLGLDWSQMTWCRCVVLCSVVPLVWHLSHLISSSGHSTAPHCTVTARRRRQQHGSTTAIWRGGAV
jgi:hypothetical protein